MRISRADRSLVSQWWYTVDRQLLAALAVLLLAGLVLSLAASPAVAMRKGLGALYFAKRQVAFLGLGAMLMLALSFLRPVQIRRIALALLLVMLALMGLVLWMGPEINGAHRWLVLSGLQLQPSELMKPAFVVLVAWLFSQQSRRADVPALPIAIGLYGLAAGLLVLQPDVGQTLLITLVWAALFFLSGQPWRRLAMLVAAGVVALGAAYAGLDHVRSRVDRFLDPSAGDTYQMDRARQSFIEGGWFGRGPGEGTIKTSLPDAHTDYVLAVVAEEYGVAACLALLCLYGFVVARLMRHVWREPDGFQRNALTGLALLLGGQALISFGVNAGLLPSKGMTLPFVSYGGSSILGLSLAMGMALALSRRRAGTVLPRHLTFAAQAGEEGEGAPAATREAGSAEARGLA